MSYRHTCIQRLGKVVTVLRKSNFQSGKAALDISTGIRPRQKNCLGYIPADISKAALDIYTPAPNLKRKLGVSVLVFEL